MVTTMTQLPENLEFSDETILQWDGRDYTFTDREFTHCIIKNATLANASFVGCRFLDCTFQNCDLSNMNVTGSTWRDVIFEDSKLIGVNWTTATALKHPIWRRCALNFCNFSGLDLRKASFAACIAREAEFGHTNLAGADCQATDFAGSRFLQTNLTKADFRQAINYAIRPGDNLLKGARFSLPEATALLYGLDIVLED